MILILPLFPLQFWLLQLVAGLTVCPVNFYLSGDLSKDKHYIIQMIQTQSCTHFSKQLKHIECDLKERNRFLAVH